MTPSEDKTLKNLLSGDITSSKIQKSTEDDMEKGYENFIKNKD